MKTCKVAALFLFSLLNIWVFIRTSAVQAQINTVTIGERPTLEQHLKQTDLETGKYTFSDLLDLGETIFAARWNKFDGQGRPAATGNGAPTKRQINNSLPFLRTSGPDATSCADCHHQPYVGGAGGFVANVFVLAQVADPVITSVASEFSNERNTLGMNGSGAIEMLAREMTADLWVLRDKVKTSAIRLGQNASIHLLTKGISFGQLIARPDGTLDTSKIEGIDTDLIIKPFHQKGVVNSVRVFTVNAYNHHHGMQAIERFGIGQKDIKGNLITTNDFDEDAVIDELSVGDITAATLFQAAMNIPGRVLADDSVRRALAQRGERTFTEIGCTDCHVPALPLNSRFFTEPNPFNPLGNLRPQDVGKLISFDLTKDIPSPQLERGASRRGNDGAIVRAFTDLKRHVICDELDPFFNNEKLVQSGVPTDQFITRKLWDVGNTAPYGHRGDLTTIAEAILHHAGEARPHRERFAALPQASQDEIVEFLKQLQVLPPNSPREITESELKRLLRSQKYGGLQVSGH